MFAYAFVRMVRHLDLDVYPVIREQLTDVLFVPAMCTFALILTRIFKQNNLLIIPWYYVLIQTLGIAIYFEWYLPNYPINGNQYTADIKDVYAYILGAVVYLFVQHRYLNGVNFRKINSRESTEIH